MDSDKNKRYAKYKEVLKKHFHFDNFRENQIEIIDQLCYYKKDVLGILPTGSGKSICFQLIPFILNKIVVIISPLISLMKDQKDNLEKLNITAIAYNSTHENRTKAKYDILKGVYKIIYLTPEYVIQSHELLKSLNEKFTIGLFAIDECHCVSSYGHSFRPSYCQLSCIKDMFPTIPIVALTGTASKYVEKDIVVQLELIKPVIIRASSDRPNLTYYINKKTDIEHDLNKLLNNDFIIIYCPTIKQTEKVCEKVNKMGVKAGFYHGRMSDTDRSAIQDKFFHGTLTCIVSTSSFGMGVNKENVRKVIHYGACKTVEDYVQEVGRGGRDGKHSECHLFYNGGDFVTNKTLISSTSNEKHRSRLYDLLDIFIKYLKFILDYFNDPCVANPDIKECCDICINKKNNEGKVIEMTDITKDCKILITLINILPGKKGVTIIVDMLRGSNSKKITPYMKTLFGYGAGLNYSVAQWKIIIDHLITLKYLAEQTIHSRFRFTVLGATEKGVNAVNDEIKIEIDSSLLKINKIDKKPKEKTVKKKKEEVCVSKSTNSDNKTFEDLSDNEDEQIKEVLKLYNKKFTIEKIADKLDISKFMVESYLCKLVEEKNNIDFSRLGLSHKIFKNIQDVVNYEFNGSVNKLANLKEKCSDKITYYEIKISKAIIDSNQSKKLMKDIDAHKLEDNDTSSDSDVKLKKIPIKLPIKKYKKLTSSDSSNLSDSSKSSEEISKKSSDKKKQLTESEISDSSSESSKKSYGSSDESLGMEFFDEYSDDERINEY
jgi:RecQ family ATP-dependent DNA helicase